MHSNLLLDTLWMLGTAIQVAICGVILWRRLLNQWPSVFSYCIVALAFDAAISLNRSNYRRYALLYWGCSLIHGLMQFWLLSDVIASLPGIEMVRARLRHFVCAFGLTIATGAVFITARDGMGHTIRSTAIFTARCGYFGWAVFLAVVLYALRAALLKWSRIGAIITNAMILQAVSGTVCFYLISFAPPSGRHSASYLFPFLSVVSLLIWLVALVTSTQENYTLNILSTAE